MSALTTLRKIVGRLIAAEMGQGNKRVAKSGHTVLYATPLGEPWLHCRFSSSERNEIEKKAQEQMVAHGYPCVVDSTIGSVRAVLIDVDDPVIKADLDRRELALFKESYGWEPPAGADIDKWLMEMRVRDEEDALE